MKSNIQLVEFCKVALKEKWGYVWGTYGKRLTPVLYDQKRKQYPNHVGRYESFILANWLGGKTVDCVGLIKAALWEKDGHIRYNPSTDFNANTMIDKCSESGTINTIPEVPGVLVWKQGHIGVYIGNGWVIEANSTKKGVIQSPLKGRGSTAWTKWGKSNFIKYEVEEKAVLKEVHKVKQRFDFLGTTRTIEVENIDGRVKLGSEDLVALGLNVEWLDESKTVKVTL